MSWRETFDHAGACVLDRCGDSRDAAIWLQAEDSDFVRFNHGRVRQPGSVRQGAVTVAWRAGRRHASGEVTLTGDRREDRGRIDRLVDDLEALVPHLAEDPHLLLPDAIAHTEVDDGGPSPDAVEAVEGVSEHASDLDLVGVYMGGAVHRGYLDSRGQRNWHTRHGYVFDLCLVRDRDKAVKTTVAGARWSTEDFLAALEPARRQLEALARPARTLDPGRYRAFLGPRAMEELLSLVRRGGFSAAALHRRQSCLGRLADGEVTLDPRVQISDDLVGGLAPAFGSDGFVAPPRVPIIVDGRMVGRLVSPRTAVELGVATTGADASETPSSLSLAPGGMPSHEVLDALGTGVWISDLWYTNHSDQKLARITGLTRFATLWVEDGEIVGPVDVARFDDSFTELLGARLVDLTDEATFLPSTSTYGGRSTSSVRTPGALVSGLDLVR